MNIVITNQCNDQCLHCYVDAGPSKREVELKLSQWGPVLKEIRAFGDNQIHLFGGEPFLVPFIREFCEMLSTMGFNFNIATNGTLIIPDDIPWIIETDVSLLISVFGSQSFHNEFTSNPQGYSTVVDNVTRLIENGVHVSIATCLMRDNMGQFNELVEFFAHLGVNYFIVLHFSPIGRGRNLKDQLIPSKDWYNFFHDLRKELPHIQQRVQHDVRVSFELATCPVKNFSEFFSLGALGPCALPWDHNLTIDWTGRVYPCVLFLNDPRWVMGSVLETPLKDMVRELTEDWLQARAKPADCSSSLCRYYRLCKGGCFAYHLESGKDYRCDDQKFIPFCPLRIVSL